MLVLASLLLYSHNLQGRARTSLFERGVLQATAPFHSGIEALCDTLGGWWVHYVWLVDAQVENDRLHLENRRLRAELSQLQEVRLANDRLQKLLDFRETQALTALPAQVITEDASSWFRTVMIDKGSDDGIREGMPVVVAEGVAGRIIKVAPGQSRVLLITDASSAMASLVQRNRSRGVCRGRGDTLIFDFVLRDKDIEVGDLVVTSGTGGVFPKGLPVGAVSRVVREKYGLFQVIEVAPAVDFSRLEEVLVLLKEEL